MKAVVFDMDGVIFDSETLVFRMWKVVAEKYGVADIEETCRACLGINATVTREIFFERYGQDFPYDKYKKEMSDLFHANAAGGKLPKKPGIRELLEYLRRENIKTAVASSTRRDLVTRELEEGGLLSYFDEIVCGDMGIFHLILHKLQSLAIHVHISHTTILFLKTQQIQIPAVMFHFEQDAIVPQSLVLYFLTNFLSQYTQSTNRFLYCL